MKQVVTLDELRQQRSALPGKVALVPTMGNLHAGHLALVEMAKELADHVVVTIFVNPMQFSSGEDIDSYPRTLQEDARKLRQAGVDLLFAPPTETIYPSELQTHTRVEVPGLSDLFCGVSRPGHFVGVATVVCKLFNMVQPDLAIFGNKDYQQLMVIRHMVDDLAMPVTIYGMDTVREPDGLAMSSRNGYLTVAERQQAPAIYAAMQATAVQLRQGRTDYAALAKQAREDIEKAGLTVDYYAIVDAYSLQDPVDTNKLVILAAAYLGKARLIDNLEVVVSPNP